MSKTEKIILLNPYGKFLGYSGMSFIIRKNKKELEKHQFFEVGEIILQSGNSVSVGSLASAGFWGIDVLILTASGKPVSTMLSLDDFSHAKTRIAQYETFLSERKQYIADQLVLGKIKGLNLLLEKYGFSGFKLPEENIWQTEGSYSKAYWKKILSLFPKKIRPQARNGYRAFDGVNNLFNSGYSVLQWKIYRAIWKSKLDPYIGFLHGLEKVNLPSLVCDLEEIYRVWVDDFVISYKPKKFKTKYEKHRGKRYPRRYLDHPATNNFIKQLLEYFEKEVKIERITRGKKQKLETLINEECSLLAMYIRKEKEHWKPRITIPD